MIPKSIWFTLPLEKDAEQFITENHYNGGVMIDYSGNMFQCFYLN